MTWRTLYWSLGLALGLALWPCVIDLLAPFPSGMKPFAQARAAEAGATQAQGNDKWCYTIDSVEDIDRTEPIRDALFEFARHRAKPLEALLDSASLASYRSLIGKHECQAAQDLLRAPYLAAHPEHACFFKSRLYQSKWRIHIAEMRYPELELCFLEKDFADAVTQMEQQGVGGPPYTTETRIGALDNDPLPLQNRDNALFFLLTMCSFADYQPACVSYVRIALTTDHVELSDKVAYYMLEKTRLLAGDDPEVTRLRAMVEPKLSSQLREALRARAREIIAREVSTEPK